MDHFVQTIPHKERSHLEEGSVRSAVAIHICSPSSFSDVSGVVCPVCLSKLFNMSDLDLESVLQKHLEDLANQTLELFDHEHQLAVELDALFLIVISIMIFIMQCGFAFLEAGSVRGV